jgi:hypothetical protein
MICILFKNIKRLYHFPDIRQGDTGVISGLTGRFKILKHCYKYGQYVPKRKTGQNKPQGWLCNKNRKGNPHL